MNELDLRTEMEARFPGSVQSIKHDRDGQTWTLSPAHLLEASEFLRDHADALYDLFLVLAATREQVCYQLASWRRRHRVRVCVPLSAEQPLVDSLAFVWPAANWAEREAYGSWDIHFQGHPELRPLLAGAGDSPRPPDGTWSAGMGHPTSIEGLFVRLRLDGEQVSEARPELGYRHTGVEKQLTRWPYSRGTLLAARLDGFAAAQCDLAYALAIESLLQVDPPPRAQRLRTILAELQRVASHLFWLARCIQRLGDPIFAASAYVWEARTAILRLFQWWGGNPIMPDLIAIGGLTRDVPSGFARWLAELLDELATWLDDLEALLSRSTPFREQLDGIGVIDPGTALGLGVTGPCLRAAGIAYDVRTAFPYSGYESLEVQVPVERDGDAGARYRVRLAEMRASLNLIRQALSSLPGGPVNAYPPDSLASGEALPALPSGAVYASVEGPRGELGIYLVADGSSRLQYVHIRGPSLANLAALPFVSTGIDCDRIAQVVDSLDISIGEAER